MPDWAYYQLYDERPVYEKWMEQKQKALESFLDREELEEPGMTISVKKG